VVSLFALGLTLTWFTYHVIPLPLQMLIMTERHLCISMEIYLSRQLCFCYLLVSRSPRMGFVGPFENLSLTLGSRSSWERGILITTSSYHGRLTEVEIIRLSAITSGDPSSSSAELCRVVYTKFYSFEIRALPRNSGIWFAGILYLLYMIW